MNASSLLVKCLGLLSIVSMTASALQTEAEIRSSCRDGYTIRVNHSQVEKADGAHSTAWIPVEIRRNIDQLGCNNEVLISSGSNLDWQLESTTHRLKIEPYDSRRNRLHVSPSGIGWLFKLSPNSTQDTLWLRVEHSTLAPPGSYFGYLELRQVAPNLHSPNTHVFTATEIIYEVEPSVALAFDASWGASTGTYFNISLGDLTLGASRMFDMVLQSNTDVVVEVSSENKGYLTHEADSSQQIGYQMRIQRSTLDLSASSSVPLDVNERYTDWRVPIMIRVPNASTKMLAGSYMDTIYIDVFPRF